MAFLKRFFVLVLACILSIFAVLAQGHSNRSYFTMSAGVGYSELLYQIPYAKPLGSIGGEFGLGYELHHNKFLFSTGLEFLLYHSLSDMDHYRTDRDTYDSEGHEVIYKYNFYKFREQYLVGNLQIPLMFGGRSHSFYGMGGVKVGFNLFGTAKIESEFETKGWYKEYIDEFENMPNHYYFQGYSATGSQKLNMSLMNVSLSGEIGWYLQSLDKFKKPNPISKIAIFFDYGLPNIVNTARNENDFIRFPRANPVDIEHYSILKSEVSQNKRVNTLFVGVKAVLLFQIRNKHTCNCIGNYYLRKNGIK